MIGEVFGCFINYEHNNSGLIGCVGGSNQKGPQKSEGSFGGILLMWKEANIFVVESIVGSFSISVLSLFNCCVNIWFTGVYGLATPHGREDF